MIETAAGAGLKSFQVVVIFSLWARPLEVNHVG
jgi:hypothetical protein